MQKHGKLLTHAYVAYLAWRQGGPGTEPEPEAGTVGTVFQDRSKPEPEPCLYLELH